MGNRERSGKVDLKRRNWLTTEVIEVTPSAVSPAGPVGAIRGSNGTVKRYCL